MRFSVVEYQQQFCPFGLMTGLKAPWAEDIAAVTTVVFPINLPVAGVVLPDLSAAEGGLALRNILCDQIGAFQK